MLYFALYAWEYPCWKGNGMSLPELPVVAECEGRRGERWHLKASGSSEDYYTMLGTVHPDGPGTKGGGCPALYRRQVQIGWAVREEY